MKIAWKRYLRALFAAPTGQVLRPPLQIGRFDLGVCPGCRGLRSVASLRCSYCTSTASVAPDT